MKRVFIVAMLAFVTSGCAELMKPEASRYSTGYPVFCFNAKQCEAMWVAVPEALEAVSGMRVRQTTDSRIVTYSETRSGRMLGEVTKAPVPSGNYAITGTFSCSHYAGCDAQAAANRFSDYMAHTGDGF